MPSDTYTLVIADAGVSTPADGSVTTAKIADYNVGIAGTGVTTAKIVDLNVTTAKLAAGAVTTAKLETSSSTITGVTTAKIADDAVTTAKIVNSAVTTAKLESYSGGSTGVTTAKIADLAVTTAKLADGAVTDAKITNGTITDAKLATISTALKVSNNATTATSANTLSAIVARDGSGNFSAGIITAALTGNATTASSIAGGTAGAIPYQTGAGTTQFTAVGTAGQLLVSNGTAAPTWSSGVGGVSSGGTGIYSYAAGDIIYADSAVSLAKRAIGSAGSVLTSNGTSPVYLTTLPVASGGTGAASLTGYVKANGTAVMTANATIPVTDGGTGFTQSAYGELYVTVSAATTITTLGTYYKVSGTTALISSANMTMPSNNRLMYGGTGERKFFVTVCGSFTGANGDKYRISIAKNGTHIDSSITEVTITGAAHRHQASCQCITALATTDFIEVFVTNATSNTTTATFEFLNLSAHALV